MDDEPVVIGDWVRERILGSGGFGIVTLWKDINTDEKIAIKKCRWGSETILTEKHKERWSKEVENMQRIQCENIVSFKKLPLILSHELMKFNPTKLPILSMEYCTKGDLRQVLNRSENCCGLLEPDVRNILADLKSAVKHLHDLKITHRDLKPENIVLQTDESRYNGIIYKLIDLGYAKEIDFHSICGSFVGTLQYLAPELMCTQTYSNSVDYWSLGLLAFEIMCGIRPFLPNLLPAQWIQQIKNKSSEHICVFETLEKEIIFSKHMYSENHISQCFRIEMEKWLRIALEMNPKKRGYLNNELVIFKLLDEILSKKVINVFSVHTYEFLSYEIDDSTLISTIQGWIERDILLPVSEQFLLKPDGDLVDGTGLAIQLFDQDYICPTAYVFKKDAIVQDNIKLKLPNQVRCILEEPRRNLSYYHYRRVSALGLYSVYQESRLYNSLLEACSLRIDYLNNNLQESKRNIQTMNESFIELFAQKKLIKEIIDCDVDFAKKLNITPQNGWYDGYNVMSSKIEKLKEATSHITTRFESAIRRISDLKQSAMDEFSKVKDHPLNSSVDEALHCYKEIRNRPKEQRNRSDNCGTMVRIIYNCLKQRDILLRDTEFRKYILQIIDISNEYDKMNKPLMSAIQHVDKFQKDLIIFQKQRQTRIWNIIIEANKTNVASPPNSSHNINSKPSQNNDTATTYISSVENDSSLIMSSNVEDADKKLAGLNLTAEPEKPYLYPQFILGNPNIPKVMTEQTYPLNKPLEFIVGNPETAKISQRYPLMLTKTTSLQFTPKTSPENNESNFTVKAINSVSNGEGDQTSPQKNRSEAQSMPIGYLTSAPQVIDFNRLSEETELIINENLNLRYALQDKTNESFMQYKSMLNEELNFDFLNEPAEDEE